MLKLYKGRTLVDGQQVEVYKNLNNGLFSIRDKKTKLVLAHGHSFVLNNVKERVSIAGRERVLKERRKNVHAYLEGEISLQKETPLLHEKVEVSYNPYKTDYFYLKPTGEKLSTIVKPRVWVDKENIFLF